MVFTRIEMKASAMVVASRLSAQELGGMPADLELLFRIHGLEGQVQMPDRGQNSSPISLTSLRQEIPDKAPGILTDPPLPIRKMTTADHRQILHQIRMEGPAQVQKRLLFAGAAGRVA